MLRVSALRLSKLVLGMSHTHIIACAEAILDEANTAFELNTGLFTALRAPTQPRLDDSTSIDSADALEKVTAATQIEAASREKTYKLGNVTAFVLALCLSHFVLVLGGFTGDKGYAKLEAVLSWLSNLLPVTQ